MYRHEIATLDGYSSDVFESRRFSFRSAAEERIAECGADVYPDGRYIIGNQPFTLRTAAGYRIFDWYDYTPMNTGRLETLVPAAALIAKVPFLGRWLANKWLEPAREAAA